MRFKLEEYFSEVLYIISMSKKTQLALSFGVFFFILINIVGGYLINNIEFNGPFSPLGDAVKKALSGRYDKAAWFALLAFLGLAFKHYHRDKKRF